MRRQHVAPWVLPFLCGMLFLTDLGTKARTEDDSLQSFYIVRFFFSVTVVKGYPLISPAAVEAARSWQFAPALLTGRPVEATLRFQLRCRGE